MIALPSDNGREDGFGIPAESSSGLASESWMKFDVTAYQAAQPARLANARAVHLHRTQLLPEVVAEIRSRGIEIHAWDVNDFQSMEVAARYEIPRICTDSLRQALEFRSRLK
jgi:glycerophosphoryl diester phosphodiesterase